MAKKKKIIIDVDYEECVEAVAISAEELSATDKEVETAVVLKRYPVVSYNKYSKVLVYNRDGQLIQTNVIAYDGSGYVEAE